MQQRLAIARAILHDPKLSSSTSQMPASAQTGLTCLQP